MSRKAAGVLVLIYLIIGSMAAIWKSGILSHLEKFSNVPVSTDCDKEINEHVYSPDRLYRLADCVSVTGVVDYIEKEQDGDSHVLIKLDDKYKNLINIFNKVLMRGDIVTEVVCQNKIEGDAFEACEGYKNRITNPPVGTHVQVNGSFVIDTSYGWTEIHPVSSYKVID